VESAAEGYSTSDKDYRSMVGKTGIAHSILRPGGKVSIEGTVFDAIAESGYIDKGEEIQVVSYQTTQLVVRKLHA
jgi:membrane-bound serine protease (ClpP class)